MWSRKNYLVESKNFCSFKTGRSCTIRSNLTSSSKNVIYLASCKKCQLQYVGSTTTEFKVRFRNQVIYDHQQKDEVAVLFNSISHSLKDFSIDQDNHASEHASIDNLLITKEAYWSAQLFTTIWPEQKARVPLQK